ncbi:Elongation factor methyltransferase 3 [Hyphodiscus hymeniophilus]|uniref:Elongation factor methyltransferase 3 n=1 Tax=Hyphodiscus hymeniophilus TaxID=353542 RepID=A0A9P6VQU2_9HELO|nr:Elongation factor methyltransferase 3 [Hyphodiscus hymeniophilus]
MESQITATARQQINRFCRQYLQLLLDPDYPDDVHLRTDAVQQFLYTRLFQENAISHPPPPRYQLRVLKELVKRIEESIQDWDEEVGDFPWGISDDLMNSLAPLLCSRIPSEAEAAQQKSFVRYSLSSLPSNSDDSPTVTLLESRNLVAAAGTTGFRTWEAALHLGDYLCTHASLVDGKSILELGSGTGYVSVLCSKHLGASRVLSTDGSDDVVDSLSTNFYLNNLQDENTIEAKELKWGHALLGSEHPQWNAGRQVDLVLGADLTYDEAIIPPLVATFRELFDLYPEVQILIAATVRNQTTFQKFLETCRAVRYAVNEMNFAIKAKNEQEGPFYSDMAPIQLCMITKPP